MTFVPPSAPATPGTLNSAGAWRLPPGAIMGASGSTMWYQNSKYNLIAGKDLKSYDLVWGTTMDAMAFHKPIQMTLNLIRTIKASAPNTLYACAQRTLWYQDGSFTCVQAEDFKVGDSVVAAISPKEVRESQDQVMDYGAIDATRMSASHIGWIWAIRERNPKPKANPRFPHKCLHCGANAYVGFNQIEHEVPQPNCRA